MYIPIGVSLKAKTCPVDWVLRHASAKPEHCSRKTPNGMQTIATGYRFMSWCRTWGCSLQVQLLVLGEDQSRRPSARSVFFLLNTPETLLLFGGNRERWANRIIWRTLSRLSTSRKAWHHWTNYIHIWISLISGSGSSLVIEPASWVPPNKSRVSGAFLQASATNEIVLSKNVKC